MAREERRRKVGISFTLLGWEVSFELGRIGVVVEPVIDEGGGKGGCCVDVVTKYNKRELVRVTWLAGAGERGKSSPCCWWVGGRHGSISRLPRSWSIRTPSEFESMKRLLDALLGDGWGSALNL